MVDVKTLQLSSTTKVIKWSKVVIFQIQTLLTLQQPRLPHRLCPSNLALTFYPFGRPPSPPLPPVLPLVIPPNPPRPVPLLWKRRCMRRSKRSCPSTVGACGLLLCQNSLQTRIRRRSPNTLWTTCLFCWTSAEWSTQCHTIRKRWGETNGTRINTTYGFHRMFSNYLLSLHWLYFLTVSAFSCGQAILYYSNRTNMEATQGHDSRPPGHYLPSGVEVVSPVMPSFLVLPSEQYPSVLITEAKGSNAVTIRWCPNHYCQHMQDKLWNESTVFFSKGLPTGLFTYQRSSKPNVLQETSTKCYFLKKHLAFFQVCRRELFQCSGSHGGNHARLLRPKIHPPPSIQPCGWSACCGQSRGRRWAGEGPGCGANDPKHCQGDGFVG